jgi:hypothetical protein
MSVRCWLLDGGKGLGDDLGAVDHILGVMTHNGQLSHGSLERVRHLLLLIDETLPGARPVAAIREYHYVSVLF